MEPVRGPTDLTVRAWWHALRDAVKRVSRPRPDRQRRRAHLLLGALDLPRADRPRLAARGARHARTDRLRCSRSSTTSARRRRSTRCDQPIDDIVESSSTAGVALILGIAAGLWTASGYVGAFMRTSNEIYGVEEDRPFWKLRPLQLADHPGDDADPRRRPDRARAHRAARRGDRRRARDRRRGADRIRDRQMAAPVRDRRRRDRPPLSLLAQRPP